MARARLCRSDSFRGRRNTVSRLIQSDMQWTSLRVATPPGASFLTGGSNFHRVVSQMCQPMFGTKRAAVP